MIQFTLGCILLALTLFFGGKELLNNNSMIERTQQDVISAESAFNRAQATKNRYQNVQNIALLKTANLKSNLSNQLSINDSKHLFDLKEETEGTTNKVLSATEFTVTGFDTFANIFTMLSDLEKLKGIEVKNVCFNCKINSEKLTQGLNDVSFKIEGRAFIYEQAN